MVSKPQWTGIHVATARSDQPSYYGPISSFYFMSRMGRYLTQTLQEPFADRNLQPRGANRKIHLGDLEEADTGVVSAIHSRDEDEIMKPLSRTQEESFIRFFWEGYHALMPILDEADFHAHYSSLWDTSKPYRKHSALADIIIALCLQYGHAFIPRDIVNASGDSRSDNSSDEAAIAGRRYYRRAQSLLTADLESPSLTTVQCYTFSAAYLCCASFHNMCHLTTGQAIRSAQVLGLHLEPAKELSFKEQELRKRVWWTLWTLDAKISSKLGRPVFVDRSQVTVTFPSDGMEADIQSGSSLRSSGLDITWLTYGLENLKLLLTVVDVYDAFFMKCGEVMGQNGLSSLYADSQTLETCAEFLTSKIKCLRDWADQVPLGLKTPRRNGGEPYSADRSVLDIDPLAPIWLQRQSVLLELIYHSMIVNLSRPFITFDSYSGTYIPSVERHATTCVDHAIAYTLIMHQAVMETDIMSGWSDYFSWQYNSAITIVGFILANPIHPATSRCRQTLDKAVAIFDLFGANFGVSADAAMIIRGLITKADKISGRLGSGITSNAPPPADDIEHINLQDGDLSRLNLESQNDPDYFNQFMDWALSVDSFNSFNNFFDSNNPADPWAFGQL